MSRRSHFTATDVHWLASDLTHAIVKRGCRDADVIDLSERLDYVEHRATVPSTAGIERPAPSPHFPAFRRVQQSTAKSMRRGCNAHVRGSYLVGVGWGESSIGAGFR